MKVGEIIPLHHEDKVIVSSMNSLMLLNLKTGKIEWKTTPPIKGAHRIHYTQNKELMFSFGEERLNAHGLKRTYGKEIWTH